MKTPKLILAVVMASIAVVGVSAALPVNTRPQPASASQSAPFDHSNCQYPDRWSNPADGCDNSDPAVPECIKAFSTKEAEDACIASFVSQHEPAATTPTVITTAPAKVSECGAK